VSSLLHASAGDAPLYMVYHNPNVPLPEDANPRDGAHHPIFGIELAEVLESFGVETTVVIQDRAEGGDPYGSLIEFIEAKLGM
jgi:hypothetical protein